jgi:hypothetical protein
VALSSASFGDFVGSFPIAAAGLAEAAWMFTMQLMYGCLAIIAMAAVGALLTRWRWLSITACVLLAAFCVFFEPWYCFTPFGPEAYEDPDVVKAASRFWLVGLCWIANVFLTVASGFAAWYFPVDGNQRPSVAKPL